jgi:hypothetical protein
MIHVLYRVLEVDYERDRPPLLRPHALLLSHKRNYEVTLTPSNRKVYVCPFYGKTNGLLCFELRWAAVLQITHPIK